MRRRSDWLHLFGGHTVFFYKFNSGLNIEMTHINWVSVVTSIACNTDWLTDLENTLAFSMNSYFHQSGMLTYSITWVFCSLYKQKPKTSQENGKIFPDQDHIERNIIVITMIIIAWIDKNQTPASFLQRFRKFSVNLSSHYKENVFSHQNDNIRTNYLNCTIFMVCFRIFCCCCCKYP